MNIRKLVINSLLLAVGAVLHQIAPPLFLGVKPDLSLAILFIIIILNDDYKTCVISGIIAGILAATTTAFPGGQIPNVIDKFVTTNVMFLMVKPFRKLLNNQIKMIVTTAVGTLVSGTCFLTLVVFMAGFPASKFTVTFIAVVLPAVLVNTIVGVILFNAINAALKTRATS